MLFSVVILSFNSQRTLDRCLRTIRSTLSKFDAPSEILVVENGSHDNSPVILQQHVDDAQGQAVQVVPIVFEENTGTTVSRNAALNISSGQYVLVLDSDAYITPEALTELKQHLDDNPTVGLVVPKLFYLDGRFQKSTDQFPTLFRKAQRFLALNKIQANEDHTKMTTHDVDYAISACWLLRRDAVDDVAGFDEAIFYSPEDVDYCMQVWAAGYRVVYHPVVSAIHDAQELSRGFKLSKFHFSHLGGLFYLFKKYRYFFGVEGLRKRLRRAR